MMKNRHNDEGFDDEVPMWRLVSGLIFQKLPGWSFPVIQLSNEGDSVELEDVEKMLSGGE